MILAMTIIFACLTTSIGLVSACAQYFEHVFPRNSYKTYVFIFAGFSAIIANVGLTQLISISIRSWLIIYPLAIVLDAHVIPSTNRLVESRLSISWRFLQLHLSVSLTD